MFWPHSPSTGLRNWFGVFPPNPTGRVSWALSHLAFLWCDHFLGSIAHFHLICCSSQSWDTVNSLLLPSLDRSLTQESKSYQRQKLLQLVKGFRKNLLAPGVLQWAQTTHPQQRQKVQPTEWKEILEVIFVLLLLSSKEKGRRWNVSETSLSSRHQTIPQKDLIGTDIFLFFPLLLLSNFYSGLLIHARHWKIWRNTEQFWEGAGDELLIVIFNS